MAGWQFTEPTLIDAEVVTKLEQLIPLVPLHQPHNLAAVRGVMQLRPDLPQVACFDTAFHRTKPKVADRFGLPDELFQRGVRRWGFHGLSYESIAGQFRQLAPDLSAGRVIVAHLGSGASLCAMKRRPKRGYHDELLGAGWAADGHTLRNSRSRRDPLPAPARLER